MKKKKITFKDLQWAYEHFKSIEYQRSLDAWIKKDKMQKVR